MTDNKGMNQLDRPWSNFDVSSVVELMTECYRQGYTGDKQSYVDGSPCALAQEWGINARKAEQPDVLTREIAEAFLAQHTRTE